MTTRQLILILLLLASVCLLPATRITPGQMIFKTSQLVTVKSDRTGLTDFDSYLNQLGASNLRLINGMPGRKYFLADVAMMPDWDAMLRGEISFDGIEYIQPNYISELHIEPTDPLYPQQFHQVVSDPQAWNYTTGSSLVVVGVVDSGVLIEHPDLISNLWHNMDEIPDDGIDNDLNGYIDDYGGWDFADAPELSDVAIGDFIGQDNDVTDENYHGTHVAGIIGAAGNNGIGIAGVCWNVKLMPVRAGFRTTAGQGYLQDDDAAASVIYAADNGCNIINMSWGDPNYSPIIGDACDYAYSKGVTLIASAGNDPGPYLSYPAKLSTVISVGAINRNRNIAGFSSYGVDMDIVAPGELVLSTYKVDVGEQYFEQSGTSMSSPFVAGAAALLLSLHPGLPPAEVRARLLTATDDLGAPGVDTYYGHGLLNTRKLLENTDPPLVYVISPIEQSGIIDDVDITGSITGSDFFRYTVMYTAEEVPTILDWYDVETHENYPNFHTQQVSYGLLAHFTIPDLFPEGRYTIRVQYEDLSGGKYNYYRAVTYDHSIPEMRPETLQGFTRWDDQNLRYYISAIFSEPVRTELLITASDNLLYRVYGTLLDSLHVWTVPEYLPEGDIDIQIRGTNTSGLTYTSGVYHDFLDIRYELVSSYGYTWEDIGNARVPLNFTADFNGNGYQEYLAMDLPNSGYGNVFVFEPRAAGHIVTYEFNDSFWPLSFGNTNSIGLEILQLKSDTAILLESQITSNYPNLPLWEDVSITGGTIADYSGDGTDDLLLVKNLPAERIIQAYKRSSNTFVTKNVLHNTSETNVRNTFVPTVLVKDFDHDIYKDILTADTDGDVMMFEIHNDNMSELTWSHRMPIGNTYNVCSGDFDGNGNEDFFVGGYYRDNLNPNLNFWYFEGFKNISNNNYTSMGSVMFNNVTSQNSIQTMDVDSDGNSEIILAISPNLYVLKYTGGEFKPQFYGSSFRTYSILTYKDINNRPYFVANYSADADTVIAVVWTSNDPYMGPPTPANFLATPQNESSIKLSWISNGADFYRIYRRDEEGNIDIIDNILGSAYLDSGLEEGKEYDYAITAVKTSFSPPESTPTVWISAIPYHIPELVSIEMVSRNGVSVIFDQPMASSIFNPGLYTLSHGMNQPTSVNSIDNLRGAYLHFDRLLPDITEDFTLSMNNIISITGIPLQDLSYQFSYEDDIVPPGISAVIVMQDKKSLQILFSESIASTDPNPEIIQHYSLFCPTNDADNSIVSVVHMDDRIMVTLAQKLTLSSSAYLITVNNIRDLAGNPISLQDNIARFSLTNIRNLSNVTVYPNPVKTSTQPWCSFLNFPAGKKGKIKIFDSSGHLVLNSPLGPFNPEINNITWHWDLKNETGHKVSSGVYFYVIEMDGEIARGKIAVIN